jgi:hypothetical protein
LIKSAWQANSLLVLGFSPLGTIGAAFRLTGLRNPV